MNKKVISVGKLPHDAVEVLSSNVISESVGWHGRVVEGVLRIWSRTMPFHWARFPGNFPVTLKLSPKSRTQIGDGLVEFNHWVQSNTSLRFISDVNNFPDLKGQFLVESGKVLRYDRDVALPPAGMYWLLAQLHSHSGLQPIMVTVGATGVMFLSPSYTRIDPTAVTFAFSVNAVIVNGKPLSDLFRLVPNTTRYMIQDWLGGIANCLDAEWVTRQQTQLVALGTVGYTVFAITEMGDFVVFKTYNNDAKTNGFRVEDIGISTEALGRLPGMLQKEDKIVFAGVGANGGDVRMATNDGSGTVVFQSHLAGSTTPIQPKLESRPRLTAHLIISTSS